MGRKKKADGPTYDERERDRKAARSPEWLKELRAKMSAAGFVRMEVWAPEEKEDRESIRKYADRVCRRTGRDPRGNC